MEPTQDQSSPAIPIAIIVGFAMIAIAIFFTNKATPDIPPPTNINEIVKSDTPRVVDESDYIKGNPNAPILLIEYADYECPFCKQFHEIMNQIMDEYGVGGRVAWVYRQFPIGQLHPNAPKISEAALCVGELGGNDAFWSFTDSIFENREVNEPVNVTLLHDYAVAAGVAEDDYKACMGSGRNQQAVTDSFTEAYSVIGEQSTPHTFVIVGDQQAVITGAQPYQTVKSVVQNLLDQLDGNIPEQTQVTQ